MIFQLRAYFFLLGPRMDQLLCAQKIYQNGSTLVDSVALNFGRNGLLPRINGRINGWMHEFEQE